MAQSDIMRLLVGARQEGEGWRTVQQLEEALSEQLHTRQVRKQVKRLVAYNIVEMRAVNARLREFRIKEAYLVERVAFGNSAKSAPSKLGGDASL